jgi:hypothetical protein
MLRVIYQHRIYRSDLKNNPRVLYLFGDNLKREGYGGQASECRGELNAFGIATKRWPGNHELAYFSDREAEFLTLEEDLVRLNNLLKNSYENQIDVVVCPSDGIGSGLSELPKRSPKLYSFLNFRLNQVLNNAVSETFRSKIPWATVNNLQLGCEIYLERSKRNCKLKENNDKVN